MFCILQTYKLYTSKHISQIILHELSSYDGKNWIFTTKRILVLYK